MNDKPDYPQNELIERLLTLYQDIIQEGVLEDMELFHVDPIRMVDGEVAELIRTITADPAMAPLDSDQDRFNDRAVFVSSILAAAETVSKAMETKRRRLEEIKAPLQRSVELLLGIIQNEKASRVSRAALEQNVEILKACIAKLDRSP